MKPTIAGSLLFLPAAAIFLILMFLPLINVVDESFREFVGGRVGSAKDAPYTLLNYQELIHVAYGKYFFDTFRISLIATLAALLIGYIMAYFLARTRSNRFRTLGFGFLISMLFLSSVVRVYALDLTFGPVGLMRTLSNMFDISPNSRGFSELLIMFGLFHYVFPLAALILVGTIQNVDPHLVDAAQVLGAPRWKAHLGITVPLSMRGVLSAFLICYTLNIGSFVAPMILGRGRVLFVSNILYNRFSEVANYPSGAAIAMVILILTLLLIYAVSRLAIER